MQLIITGDLVPITDKRNLIAPTCTINGIKAFNPSLVTLANNHILDQDEQGLKSTKYIECKPIGN